MQKIPTLFERDYDGGRRGLVRNAVTPGCEWVLAGEGVATRKYDGWCCLVKGGRLFKRQELRPGHEPPFGFEPADDADPVTGKLPGWVPVGDGPDDRWHREAWDDFTVNDGVLLDGTYELVGPKVQGNPEGYGRHFLLSHEFAQRLEPPPPRDFEGLRAYLATHAIEGIVWHHPDGRMAKLKARDFGLRRCAAPTVEIVAGTAAATLAPV